MPATPEEMKAIVDAYEGAHPSVARALADLLERGKCILEEHRMLDTPLAGQLEAVILKFAAQHGVSRQMLNDTTAALERMRITVDHLERLS